MRSQALADRKARLQRHVVPRPGIQAVDTIATLARLCLPLPSIRMTGHRRQAARLSLPISEYLPRGTPDHDPKQTFTLPIPGPSRRQEVPLVRVGVIDGLESVVDITCQPRRAVLLFESL